jgi:hypothetical protein
VNPPTAPRRPRAEQRGAAVLEMVLVVPLIMLLMFGIGEFGLAWVDGNKLEGAVSTAARVGSSQGSTADADRAILLSLQASMPDDLIDNITRVVVYESDHTGFITPSCLTAGRGGGVASGAFECNVYDASDVRNVTPTSTTHSGPQSDWAPGDRDDRLVDPPDYIGVLVQTRHDDFSGTFWRDGFELERRSIYRIAPDFDG